MVNPLINLPICRSLMVLIAVGAVALQPHANATASPENGASPTQDTTQTSETNGVDSSDRNNLAPRLIPKGDLDLSNSSGSLFKTALPSSEPSLEVSDDVSHIEPLTEILPSQVQKIPVPSRAESVTLESPSQIDPLLVTQATEVQKTLPEETVPEETPPFGEAGQGYWYLQGAGAVSFDPDDDGTTVFGLVGAGISHFFVDGLSITLELNQMGFIQSGEDALGLNLSSQLRWHFYRQPKWSVYIDGGAGILGTTSDVPSSGSQFNFTPQVGAGATINLRGAEQLMVGVRWHHISNAELYEANPGRDSIMLYGGWIMPR